jgi:hypothetical protein
LYGPSMAFGSLPDRSSRATISTSTRSLPSGIIGGVKNSTFWCVIAAFLLGHCFPALRAGSRQNDTGVVSRDCTRDLPSVERVKSEPKGTDANDTIARQVAAVILADYAKNVAATMVCRE